MKCLAVTWAEDKVLGSRGLRAWAASILKAVPDCDVVIASPVPCNVPGTRNVIYPALGPPWQRRWTVYADLIRQSDADAVMLSDSRDLIVQDNPFAMFRSERVIVGGEVFKAKEHPWCSKMEQEVRARVGQSMADKEVINGGIQIGMRSEMLTFAHSIDAAMQLKVCNTDQAFINWWFYERCPFTWSFGPPGWYLHGEAARIGKLSIVVIDGVAGTRLTPPPAFQPAIVFHQYDRCGQQAILFRYASPADASVLVLVAHYKEDLGWLYKSEYDFKVISKGPSPPPIAATLPNFGNEAQTWAWFFSENYDKLPLVTACLQGQPFKHCPEPVIKSVISKMAGGQFAFAPISGIGHSALTWIDNVEHHRGLPLLAWWQRLFKSQPPGLFHVQYGGQFAVHRDAVRARPREFWRKLSEECKTKEDACCLERLWQFIFSGTA